jgi:HSP20 family molecular chaperone IbpA
MSTSANYLFAQPFFEEFFGHDLARNSKVRNDRYNKLLELSTEKFNSVGSITTMPDGTVKIEEEVPGFSKEDVTVVLKEGRLSVSLKREGRKEKHFTYHVSSKVDTTKITASCKDGILTMLLPPVTKKQVEPLTIAVS